MSQPREPIGIEGFVKAVPMPSLSAKRESEFAKLNARNSSEDDPHPDVYGVLLSDEIRFYANAVKLIDPFDEKNLKPAAYELTLGDEYFLSGEFLRLRSTSSTKSKVMIPPFQVAVLKTAEILCIPRYLIARWNIRVRHAYSGLLWVGGPQVDPGYIGHLFCPIYNLSDKEVTLHMGEPIAVIDFVKTTPFASTSAFPGLIRYPHPPKRVIMEDYGIDELRSALFTKAGERLIEFEAEIKSQNARFTTYTQISFAIFALLISLVAIISKSNIENISLGASFWGISTVFLATFALLVSVFSYVGPRVGRLVYEQYGRVMGARAESALRFIRRAWWAGVGTSFVICAAGAYFAYSQTPPALRDIRMHKVLTKTDIDNTLGTELHDLAIRVEHVERSRSASVDDLEQLRAKLEGEIQQIRAGSK